MRRPIHKWLCKADMMVHVRHLSPVLFNKVSPYLPSLPLCVIRNCIIALLAGNSIKPMASLQLSISIISVLWMVMSQSKYSAYWAEMEFWRKRDKTRHPKLRSCHCSSSKEEKTTLCIRREKGLQKFTFGNCTIPGYFKHVEKLNDNRKFPSMQHTHKQRGFTFYETCLKG